MNERNVKKHHVANIDEVVAAGKKIIEWNGLEIGIFHVNGEFHAWRNLCPHFAAPVCEGHIRGTRLFSDIYEYHFGRESEILRCPWHGWEFDLKTGKLFVDESIKLRGYPIEWDDKFIYILSNKV